jgi:signal transduction histidine kinase
MLLKKWLKNREQKHKTKLGNTTPEEKTASLATYSLLTNMSHEIRTPMNMILGLAEILLENKSLPPDVMESLEKIHGSGNMLMGIINDTLDLSEIEAGRLELKPVKYETANLINDTVSLNLVRFENKPVVFKLQVDENIPSALYGDDLRIKQILNNLLCNAAQYTERGRVTLSIAAEYGGGNNEVTLVLKVQDTGQLGNDEKKGGLSEKHTRLNIVTDRIIEGTGLEMSVARNLIKMMNGTISAESDPGKGTEFTVRLPQGNTDSGRLGMETARNLRQFRLNKKSRIKYAPIIRESMSYSSVLVVDGLEYTAFKRPVEQPCSR